MDSPATTTTAQNVDDFVPTFYVGHHETTRELPITELKLRQSQEAGYDMLTTPITNSHFHSRVLTLLSEHITKLDAQDYPSKTEAFPIIPPFNAVDTPLTPGDVVNQLVGHTSAWIDISSPDPLVANISRQVLTMEIAYAAFCGVNNIIIPGPRKFNSSSAAADGIARYARAIQEALAVAGYVQFAISLPMYSEAEGHAFEPLGDLDPFVREEYQPEHSDSEHELFGTWDAWNVIRSVCKYNTRLSVALQIPKQLPTDPLQSRWFAEPLRILSFTASTFLKNKGGHPVLSKNHQALLTRYMRLKNPPWILLTDVAPIPDVQPGDAYSLPTTPQQSTASVAADPTPTELAARQKQQQSAAQKIKDATSHLVYIRYLQRNQPPRNTIERFGAGYQDYLQAPLQPLADNLESVTYEVFEKDPVKYDQYEAAIYAALVDWRALDKPTSSPDGKVVVVVAGAGRGPLMTRALKASRRSGVLIQPWVVEKNPNAYVLLQRRNEEDWDGQVSIVKSDMRAWKGPLLRPSTDADNGAGPQYGKVDILISELLGSFADNELSPECLDGVQHVLAPTYGISIPSSYTAHLSPILAPKLHADIQLRAMNDPAAADTPYVVMLHQIDFLAVRVPGLEVVQEAWEFVHPLPEETLRQAEARRQGGVSGGGGGSMAGGDGSNEHNARYSRTKFVVRDRGVCHGIAGYFESVLYDGRRVDEEEDVGPEQIIGEIVEISTHPGTIDAKSKDMISWFPIYFPLKTPLYVPDDSEVEVSIWRQTDDRKVWYEWCVEAFALTGPNRRVRVGMSEVGSSRKQGCLM